ncbi:3-dehydroquinate synthase [Bacillus sp. REN3]|uniref:3-dehydroquinate synthase n=1 Tax=Bacillus sp. REN3 TaxID=2802440 RepID=UPI001AEECD45|nr:3-dehydroquinate synthase [Bacillus sp. REN3]
MDQIEIRTNQKTYPVLVGEGVIKALANHISDSAKGYSSVMVITDETVAGLYLPVLKQNAGRQSLYEKIVPSGEAAKTFSVFYDCLTAALENKLDRKSLIIAFGGGAVGDLAGFVASAYMRGIRFIQVPTTILAHDSAVGGKVAINHPLGKNMIGAFHQPEAVIYDLDFLKSLPANELRSGFAEIVKHALISGEPFYNRLKEEVKSLELTALTAMADYLTEGIKVKGRIVAEDERETGVRSFLNFGHTLGHAIEAEIGYGKITHGEAVAIGMVFALRLSCRVNGLVFDLAGFENWLHSLGYQVFLPAGLEADRLVARMKQDKKAVRDTLRFVLLEKLGTPLLAEVDEQELIDALNGFKKGGETFD